MPDHEKNPPTHSPRNLDDVLAISDLVNESFFLPDCGQYENLVETVFALEEDGVAPEADFGFAVWRGVDALRAGFNESLPRFHTTFHAVSNMTVTVDGDRASARYYLQGWHWFTSETSASDQGTVETEERNADYLLLALMVDHYIRQHGQWRILRRQLKRFGPGMAFGAVQPWLSGLGK